MTDTVHLNLETVENITDPSSTPTGNITPSPIPKKPKNWIWTILAVILLVISIFTYFVLKNGLNNTESVANNDSNISKDASQNSGIIYSNPTNSIVYIKNSSKEKVVSDNEVWIIDLSSREEQKLDIIGATEAYKYPNSSELWFRMSTDKNGAIHVLDLAGGTSNQYIPVTHPDPETHETLSIGNINHISPDGKWIVVNIEYFKDCPPPPPLPSGFEGGWGPCQPEQNIEYPNGLHLYNRDTKKLIYLDSGFLRFSRWDIDNNLLYYVNGDKHITYALDLNNLNQRLIDSSSAFGYFTYPLPRSGSMLKFEGGYQNTSYSEVSVVNLNTQQKEVLDSADSWAELQPFMTSSPDEKYYLLTRSPYIEPKSEGQKKEVLISYNTLTNTKSPFKPVAENASLKHQGIWVSDTEFVTQLHEYSNNFVDNVNDLVILNLETQSIIPLTNHGDVFGFGGQ